MRARSETSPNNSGVRQGLLTAAVELGQRPRPTSRGSARSPDRRRGARSETSPNNSGVRQGLLTAAVELGQRPSPNKSGVRQGLLTAAVELGQRPSPNKSGVRQGLLTAAVELGQRPRPTSRGSARSPDRRRGARSETLAQQVGVRQGLLTAAVEDKWHATELFKNMLSTSSPSVSSSGCLFSSLRNLVALSPTASISAINVSICGSIPM